MEGLSNAFSVLEVAADDHFPTSAASSASSTSGSKSNGKDNYRLPLVWIDMEMTGLDVEVDKILEIACIITDGKLTKSLEVFDVMDIVDYNGSSKSFLRILEYIFSLISKGPDLVIHQSKECLDRMGEWCQDHHGASGLTQKVLESKVSEREAEKQVIEFVKRNVGSYKPHLAGNSVYMDFFFLRKYMPELAGLFSHVIVDVSSVRALCTRWYPKDRENAPPKKKNHRAMDDIRESILELKYFKETIFKGKSKK